MTLQSPIDLADAAYVTEDLKIFREAVGKFLEREAVPHREKWEKEEIIDRALWEKAGQNGFLLASGPEEYGGAGGDFSHEAIIIEQIGRAGMDGFGISLHNGIVAPYITQYGSEEQKRKWLPKLASGELIAAIAMTEPSTGSDLQSIKTTAKKDGNHYVINGQKTFITNGQHANLIVVVTKTDPTKGAKGTSLVIVETDEVEGFRRGRNLDKIGLKSQDTSELFFDDVRVPTSNLLGPEEGQGFVQLMEKLPQERLIIALQGLAMIERALSETIAYTKDRKSIWSADLGISEHPIQIGGSQDESDSGQSLL